MRLTDRVQHFSGLRALVVGDALLDRYIEGSATRLCAEGPVPVVRRQREQHSPGGAANTAANLQALGSTVLFLATVGTDSAAEMLRQALRQLDVDDRYLIPQPGAETIQKTRVMADGHYVVRFDSEDGCRPTPESSRRLADLLQEHCASADLVLTSDYGYGAVSAEVIDRLRRLRQSRPLPLIIDAKQLSRYRGLESTVVTPNLGEAYRFLHAEEPGRGEAAQAELPSIADALLAQLPTEHVVITLGAAGAYVASRAGERRRLASRPVTGQPVGAGDSFAAALGLALAAGAGIQDAARVGMEAAAIAVAKPGTAVVRASELISCLSDRSSEPAPPRPLSGSATAGSRLDQVTRALERNREEGRSVVFTNGVFDLLHAGHIELLRRARDLGDLLVVGINSDQSVRRLKGRSRPINHEQDRLAVISALSFVDHAFLFDPDTAIDAIQALRPDIYVKGGDYRVETLPEAPAMREIGGRIVILPHLGGLSTSGLIDRILSLSAPGRLVPLPDSAANAWA